MTGHLPAPHPDLGDWCGTCDACGLPIWSRQMRGWREGNKVHAFCPRTADAGVVLPTTTTTGGTTMTDLPHVPRDTAEPESETVLASPNTDWFCDRAKSIIGGGGQRRQDYGDALDSFEAIAALWSVVLGTNVTAEQVALCQAMLKMGRLLNTPNHEDSWVDIIGYAALGGDIAMRPGRNGNPA